MDKKLIRMVAFWEGNWLSGGWGGKETDFSLSLPFECCNMCKYNLFQNTS